MNKKAAVFGVFVIVMVVLMAVVLIVYGVISLSHVKTQSGQSVDYVYSVETGQLSRWHKLWLTNDHTTVYCFENLSFVPVLQDAQDKNIKVKVFYDEYFFKGVTCSTENSNIGIVVVSDIEEVH